MSKQLFKYQSDGVKNVIVLKQKGYKKVLCVLPGGGGKTLISSAINKELNIKSAFFVHREELFNQTREEYLEAGIITEPINSSTKSINPNANAFVCMIETFFERCNSESFLSYFKDVQLIFIDEAHRDDFFKIMHLFENAFFIGLTATPVSSNKKRPMNKVWDVMLEIEKVSGLQHLNTLNPKVGVVPSFAYELRGIDRDKLKKKGDDFDEKLMSSDYRNKKQIQNTLERYFEYGKGMKGLCFNCDIEHNETMYKEFLYYGVETRMLHSDKKRFLGATNASMMKNWRKDTLLWLKHTSGAMLHNVGILTTGFNERSIELIMTNFSTLSISKFIQCIVRGARPFQYANLDWKELYLLLDFGQNLRAFGDGNNDIPWQEYFDSPASTSIKTGAGGYKSCPECGSLNTVSSRFCKGFKENWLTQEKEECGYCFPLNEKQEDTVPRLMVKYFNDVINVSDMCSLARINGHQLSSVYYKILDRISSLCKENFGTFLLAEQFDFILDIAYKKLKELSKVTGKRTWRDAVKKTLIPKLRECGIVLDIGELGDEDLLKELKELESKNY